MWYLFKNRQCIGTISGEPNHEDLATRNEKAVESDLILPISEVGLDENGNVIQVIPPEPPPPSPEEIQKEFENAVVLYMNKAVNERGYDTIYTASNYAGSNHPKYGPEGRACLEWMCNVWDTCYAILGEVTAGRHEIPTAEELLAELPELVWPEV